VVSYGGSTGIINLHYKGGPEAKVGGRALEQCSTPSAIDVALEKKKKRLSRAQDERGAVHVALSKAVNT